MLRERIFQRTWSFCLIGLQLATILLQSCLNPFAPKEGDVGERTWSDQATIGELLHNFALAYDYKDSLRYAGCLAESFVFHYFDVDEGRFDSWFRETDLKATGGMFRSFNDIDLEWNLIPEFIDGFSQPDTTVDFIVRFNLTLDQEAPLMGYASFSVKRSNDGKFRVVAWRDDF